MLKAINPKQLLVDIPTQPMVCRVFYSNTLHLR